MQRREFLAFSALGLAGLALVVAAGAVAAILGYKLLQAFRAKD